MLSCCSGGLRCLDLVVFYGLFVCTCAGAGTTWFGVVWTGVCVACHCLHRSVGAGCGGQRYCAQSPSVFQRCKHCPHSHMYTTVDAMTMCCIAESMLIVRGLGVQLAQSSANGDCVSMFVPVANVQHIIINDGGQHPTAPMSRNIRNLRLNASG